MSRLFGALAAMLGGEAAAGFLGELRGQIPHSVDKSAEFPKTLWVMVGAASIL